MTKKTGMVECAGYDLCKWSECSHKKAHKRKASCGKGCQVIGGIPTAICVKIKPVGDVAQRRML